MKGMSERLSSSFFTIHYSLLSCCNVERDSFKYVILIGNVCIYSSLLVAFDLTVVTGLVCYYFISNVSHVVGIYPCINLCA